jgi:hypothetical protein
LQQNGQTKHFLGLAGSKEGFLRAQCGCHGMQLKFADIPVSPNDPGDEYRVSEVALSLGLRYGFTDMLKGRKCSRGVVGCKEPCPDPEGMLLPMTPLLVPGFFFT